MKKICTNAELNCRPTAYETVALPLSYTCRVTAVTIASRRSWWHKIFQTYI
jgi:hypothetical protein